MILPRYYAFVDESGNTSLNFSADGSSTHYVVVAVIVAADVVQSLCNELEVVRRKHFQSGEIKSSNIGKKDHRRQKILDELLLLDWCCIALVVDKRSLTSKGFEFKGSFVKNLQGRLYKRLFHTFPDLRVDADAYGRDSFLTGFTKYVEERHRPTLFDRSGIEFSSSKDSLGIQLADFVAGTIARGYEQKNLSDPEQHFMKQLLQSKRLLSVFHYPFPRQQFRETALCNDLEFQEDISETAYNSALLFLEENESSTAEDDESQCSAVEFLLMHFVSSSRGEYAPTHEIMEHIRATTGQLLSVRQFRGLIGKIRDRGVLVASSKDGYRLPSHKSDIWNFLRHQNQIVGPILGRVRKCRERIKSATLGQLDVLDESEFALLKQLVDGFKVE